MQSVSLLCFYAVVLGRAESTLRASQDRLDEKAGETRMISSARHLAFLSFPRSGPTLKPA